MRGCKAPASGLGQAYTHKRPLIHARSYTPPMSATSEPLTGFLALDTSAPLNLADFLPFNLSALRAQILGK